MLQQMVAGQSGPQIAHVLGITKQRVDQIQKALVGKGRLERAEHEYRIVVPRG